MNGLADAFADDVEWWEIGADEPVRGKQALMERMQTWADYEISTDLHDVVANDDHLIALLNVTAQKGDESFAYRTAEISPAGGEKSNRVFRGSPEKNRDSSTPARPGPIVVGPSAWLGSARPTSLMGLPMGANMETDEKRQQEMEQARKFIGFVVAVLIVFFAQRDLRRRSPELIRGSAKVWRVVAMVPPGAVTYLFLGRRRAAALLPVDPGASIAA